MMNSRKQRALGVLIGLCLATVTSTNAAESGVNNCSIAKPTLRDLRNKYELSDARLNKTMEFMYNAQIHGTQFTSYISRAKNEQLRAVGDQKSLQEDLRNSRSVLKVVVDQCESETNLPSATTCSLTRREFRHMQKLAESAVTMAVDLESQLGSQEINKPNGCPTAVAVAYTSIQKSDLAVAKLSEAFRLHAQYCR